jgi:hypothetical protein
LPFEQTRQERVIYYHAQKQIDYRPYTQPIERASIMPAQMMTRTIGNVTKAPQQKQKSTRSEAVRTAKARITRRNSLRKQREALKR